MNDDGPGRGTGLFLIILLLLNAVLGVFGGMSGALSTGTVGQTGFVVSHLVVGLVVAFCWWASKTTMGHPIVWAACAALVSTIGGIFRESLHLLNGTMLVIALAMVALPLRATYDGDLRKLFRDMTTRTDKA
jgi:hypothetical protein